MIALLTDTGLEVRADPRRVLARLFIPGETAPGAPSRSDDIIARVLARPAEELARTAATLRIDFGERDTDFLALARDHARAVQREPEPALDPDAELVLGATFTAEYAVEAAALCNPSAVPSPDQSGLAPGELRIVLAMRSIGEGHISSISFLTAVIDADGGCVLEPRQLPLARGVLDDGVWRRAHLREALQRDGRLTEIATDVLRLLPERFENSALDAAIAALPTPLLARRDAREHLDAVRRMVWSAYRVIFDPTQHLSRRILLPAAEEESHGMEDARFVRFSHDDGHIDYRATYTAYDGRSIAPRLLVTTDFTEFSIHRLTGSAAHNKGMALFPRAIDGIHWALTRGDGENISLARSRDGMDWKRKAKLWAPHELWEVVQAGNCGSPIETERGWLVLTHGVGPMRRYSIGAILLDLADPTRVIGRLEDPLLSPDPDDRDGYVPNVVYSCGALVHEGTLWLPYGVTDDHIRIAHAPLDAVLAAMVAPARPTA